MVAIIVIKVGTNRFGFPYVSGSYESRESISSDKRGQRERAEKKKLKHPKLVMIAGRNMPRKTEKQQPTKFQKISG